MPLLAQQLAAEHSMLPCLHGAELGLLRGEHDSLNAQAGKNLSEVTARLGYETVRKEIPVAEDHAKRHTFCSTHRKTLLCVAFASTQWPNATLAKF
jgi:hypothetical protein